MDARLESMFTREFETRALRGLDDARRFFQSMGCTTFHMVRENEERHAEYRAMAIAQETEREWILDALSKLCAWMHDPTTDADELWNLHSHAADLTTYHRSPDAVERFVAATDAIVPRLAGDSRVIVAETLVGRGGENHPIRCAFDQIGRDPAIHLCKTALDLSRPRHSNRNKRAYCRVLETAGSLDLELGG